MELESLTFISTATSPDDWITMDTLMMDKLSWGPKRQHGSAVAACLLNVAWRRSPFFNVGNPQGHNRVMQSSTLGLKEEGGEKMDFQMLLE